MKKVLFLSLLPFFVLPQGVLIQPLSHTINTNNAEINFVQTNDTVAFFTMIKTEKNKLESKIYSVTLKNKIWQENELSVYNFDNFNTSNICFSDGHRIFLTICENGFLACRTVYVNKGSHEHFNEIPYFFSDSCLTTQPFITKHNLQTVFYFVSDREGGFGGLDIWISVVDSNGNFGYPINAGNNINSAADEITPFYNKQEGKIYFSSNRAGGLGGFDIYSSLGKLNFWQAPTNIIELNSNKDELYLNFFNEDEGYFSSNRKGAKFQNTEHCCNDIFSFIYLTDSVDTNINYNDVFDYLPIKLYFHNDDPDFKTNNQITTKSYKDSYVSYFLKQPDYEAYNPDLANFFENILKIQFNNLNKFLERLIIDLAAGKKLEIQIKGHSSPLHDSEYNKKLSQRRIASVINYLIQFKNGSLKNHVDSGALIIRELSYGEDRASKYVSDDAGQKNKSIYSIDAMKERKVEIVDIILKK